MENCKECLCSKCIKLCKACDIRCQEKKELMLSCGVIQPIIVEGGNDNA